MTISYNTAAHDAGLGLSALQPSQSEATRTDAASLTREMPRRRSARSAWSRWASRIPALIVSCLLIAALIYGWVTRNDGHLTPENGVGYWLGIWGGSAMLLLLAYPLRKRIKSLKIIGTVAGWFRLHMLLGLIGPVLILYHANFKFGSTNSNVALISMMTVAISGLAGRYLYGKIHLGLYGRRAVLGDVMADVQSWQRVLGEDLPQAADIAAELAAFTQEATRERAGVCSSLIALMTLGGRTRRCRRRLMRQVETVIAHQANANGWSRRTCRTHRAAIRAHLNYYLRAVRRAAAFAVFERLFALWHVLHLPLFILLIITATLHVIAVHTY